MGKVKGDIPTPTVTTITNQWCLQKLQNEFIPDFQGAGHVDTFFPQDGTCPLKANGISGIWHEVFGSTVLSNQFTEHFRHGWSWTPYSPDMHPCDYILSDYLKYHAYCTNTHTSGVVSGN